MTSTKIGELTFQCQQCGSTEFRIPEDATESSLIYCAKCEQEIGTVADFNPTAVEQGRAAIPQIADAVADAFKGIKGFKRR